MNMAVFPIEGKVEILLNGIKLEGGCITDDNLNIKNNELDKKLIYECGIELKADKKAIQEIFDYFNNIISNFKAFMRSVLNYTNKLN